MSRLDLCYHTRSHRTKTHNGRWSNTPTSSRAAQPVVEITQYLPVQMYIAYDNGVCNPSLIIGILAVIRQYETSPVNLKAQQDSHSRMITMATPVSSRICFSFLCVFQHHNICTPSCRKHGSRLTAPQLAG